MFIMIQIHPPKPGTGEPDTSKALDCLLDQGRVIQVISCDVPSMIAGLTKPATLWTVAELGNLISPLELHEAELLLAQRPTTH